jgi:hypothetical protein
MKSDLPKGLATPPTPFPPPYAVNNPFYGVTNRYDSVWAIIKTRIQRRHLIEYCCTCIYLLAKWRAILLYIIVHHLNLKSFLNIKDDIVTHLLIKYSWTWRPKRNIKTNCPPIFVRPFQTPFQNFPNTCINSLCQTMQVVFTIFSQPTNNTSLAKSPREADKNYGSTKVIDERLFLVCHHQSCESRRQTFSSISRPRFREIWKVSALSRSLTRKSRRGRDRDLVFRDPTPPNESPIANR